MKIHQSSAIFIRECRVNLRIGLNAEEQEAPQPVSISVQAHYAPDTFFPDVDEKSRHRIIDYSLIHNFLTQGLPAIGHLYLLEAAAERIVAFCFQDLKIQSVTVRLEKTQIFTDAAGAGVEVSRTRTDRTA